MEEVDRSSAAKCSHCCSQTIPGYNFVCYFQFEICSTELIGVLMFCCFFLQSGRFGKLNKRVTFPVTLDLVPYMSEARDNTDLYELYAVVVHIDMLNASFFGHYICYTKDFHGNWYRVDDCKVQF